MHTIRLRGPWELHVDGQPPLRLQMPEDGWPVDSDRTSALRLVRFFNCPTGIDGQTVHVSVRFGPGCGQLTLNGQTLGPVRAAEPTRFAVTNLLTPRNQLVIDVDLPPPHDAAQPGYCDVQLEIE